jgi:hypothetical protein
MKRAKQILENADKGVITIKKYIEMFPFPIKEVN